MRSLVLILKPVRFELLAVGFMCAALCAWALYALFDLSRLGDLRDCLHQQDVGQVLPGSVCASGGSGRTALLSWTGGIGTTWLAPGVARQTAPPTRRVPRMTPALTRRTFRVLTWPFHHCFMTTPLDVWSVRPNRAPQEWRGPLD